MCTFVRTDDSKHHQVLPLERCLWGCQRVHREMSMQGKFTHMLEVTAYVSKNPKSQQPWQILVSLLQGAFASFIAAKDCSPPLDERAHQKGASKKGEEDFSLSWCKGRKINKTSRLWNGVFPQQTLNYQPAQGPRCLCLLDSIQPFRSLPLVELHT